MKFKEYMKTIVLCLRAFWRVTDVFWIGMVFISLAVSIVLLAGYLYKWTGYSPEMNMFMPLVLEWLIDGGIVITSITFVTFVLHGIYVGMRKLCKNIYKEYKQLCDSIHDEYKKLKEVSK